MSLVCRVVLLSVSPVWKLLRSLVSRVWHGCCKRRACFSPFDDLTALYLYKSVLTD